MFWGWGQKQEEWERIKSRERRRRRERERVWILMDVYILEIMFVTQYNIKELVISLVYAE